MKIGTYEIEIQTNTTTGFDHEHHQWDPAYLHLDSGSLMATGMGKLHVTGYTTRAKACTPNPAQMARVAARYREITGEDLPLLESYHFGVLSGAIV